jgi:hypothetical protein
MVPYSSCNSMVKDLLIVSPEDGSMSQNSLVHKKVCYLVNCCDWQELIGKLIYSINTEQDKFLKEECYTCYIFCLELRLFLLPLVGVYYKSMHY